VRESGERKPTLELLLPITRALETPFDELVGLPTPSDPRVHSVPVRRRGRTLFPLTRRPGAAQAYKMVLPPLEADSIQKMHPGHEWMYVLSGRVRLLLGDLDLTLQVGEVAEFDTRTPHWFGAVGARPAELLVLFGPQGERMHVRARSARG
jgi:quercetin dioxygenase-like cupin family protein